MAPTSTCLHIICVFNWQTLIKNQPLVLLGISRHHMLNLRTDFSISIIISSVSGCSALIAWSATKLNAAAVDCGSRFIAVTFNLPLTERRHLSCLSLWDSLICSEKSLALRRDYPLIINHIQMRENKFCLHVSFFLLWGRNQEGRQWLRQSWWFTYQTKTRQRMTFSRSFILYSPQINPLILRVADLTIYFPLQC